MTLTVQNLFQTHPRRADFGARHSPPKAKRMKITRLVVRHRFIVYGCHVHGERIVAELKRVPRGWSWSAVGSFPKSEAVVAFQRREDALLEIRGMKEAQR